MCLLYKGMVEWQPHHSPHVDFEDLHYFWERSYTPPILLESDSKGCPDSFKKSVRIKWNILECQKKQKQNKKQQTKQKITKTNKQTTTTTKPTTTTTTLSGNHSPRSLDEGYFLDFAIFPFIFLDFPQFFLFFYFILFFFGGGGEGRRLIIMGIF